MTTSMDPGHRFTDPATGCEYEVGPDGITRWVSVTPLAPTTFQPPVQPPKKSRKKLWLWGGGIVLVLGVAGSLADDSTPTASPEPTVTVTASAAPSKPAVEKTPEPVEKTPEPTVSLDYGALYLVFMQSAWDQQTAEGQESMCLMWPISPDYMIESVISGAKSEGPIENEAAMRIAIKKFFNEKCG